MLAQRLAVAPAMEPRADRILEVTSYSAIDRMLDETAFGVRSPHYRALLMRLRADTDFSKLGARLERAFAIEVIDSIGAQLRELCKIRRPREKLDHDALELDAGKFCPPSARLHYGVWALFPWSRRLVHLVNEAEFIELRTNRNLYKISHAEQAALRGKRIGIVGASAGQAVALAMAAERSCGEIRLADFDTLDATNLNRLRGGVQQLGVPKVVIAAREIAELDPFLHVDCYPHGIASENVGTFLSEGGKLDLVIEEADSLDIKFLVREHARSLRIPVLMDTSDRGLLDVERFDLEPARPLFHGLAPNLDLHSLAQLSGEEKVPHLLDLLGVDNLSTRLRASMLEIEQTISTWPQLASSVYMGGAIAADTARRILLGERIASGRYYVDLRTLIPAAVEDAPTQLRAPVTLRAHHADALLHRAIDAATATPGIDLDRRVVEDLVAAGIAAPSGGNAQPWRWAYGRGTLLLMRDQASESFLDINGWGSLVALGAAAENVRLRAAVRGLDTHCHAFPLQGDALRVAALRFSPVPHSTNETDLAAQISRRRTDRRMTEPAVLPASALSALQTAASAIDSARLQFVSNRDGLVKLAHLLGVTQQLLLQHDAAHAQMMHEIQWEDAQAPGSGHGISLESLALSPLDRAGLDLCRDYEVSRMNKAWGGGSGLRRFAEKNVRACSAMALLSMPACSASAYFEGGRAMQRAWLTATREGLAVHPISALPFLFARLQAKPGSLPPTVKQTLEELWPDYASLFDVRDEAAGILLFRLGMPAGEPLPAAPRRPVSQVLRFL